MSELENAYRTEFDMPDSVGMYLFWRDKAKVILDRDAVLDIYVKAMEEYEIPLLSIEDGFAEDDFEGWRLLLERLGDNVFVIGDDLVTTNDKTIETASSQGLINAALIKANQIGSLYETLLAMLVALGKGLDLVVSHRSKSPNDDMEAQIASGRQRARPQGGRRRQHREALQVSGRHRADAQGRRSPKAATRFERARRP